MMAAAPASRGEEEEMRMRSISKASVATHYQPYHNSLHYKALNALLCVIHMM